MFDLIVKNGQVVTSQRIYKADICIKDGKISAIVAPESDLEANKVIDAGGKYIFPGAIDTHAHLNDPGYTWREDYEHGTAAAAVGGITTIIDMPLQNEPALTDGKIFDDKYKARVVFDYIHDKFRIDILFIDTNEIIIEKENLEEHEVIDILNMLQKEDKNKKNIQIKTNDNFNKKVIDINFEKKNSIKV